MTLPQIVEEVWGEMGTHHVDGEYLTGDANRRLVRFFNICLGTLLFAYSILAFRLFLDQ